MSNPAAGLPTAAHTFAQTAGLSLRRQLGAVLLIFAVAIVTVAVIGGIVYANLNQSNRDLTRELFAAQSATRDFYEAAIDQETSVRGFQLDNDVTYLEPYANSQPRFESALATLRPSLESRPFLIRQLDETNAALQKWRSEYAEPIIALRKQGAPAAEQQTAYGKLLFDKFRGNYSVLYDGIIRERTISVSRQNNSLVQFGVALTVAVLLLLLMEVVAWQLLNRRIVGPVARLLDDVGRVTGGDIDHKVTGTGPVDVVALGRGVDAMRRRIVGELKDVDVARLELARSNADLEQFAYVASHDLQEPLRKVASFCQLLEQRYTDQLDDRGKQYIDFAVDGAKRMQRLISDLLAFSRVGRNTAAFEPVDLNGSVASALENLSEVVTATKADIQVDALPTIQGEPTLLLALFQNLIGNAMKFRQVGVQPEIRVTVRSEQGDWRFSVSDNGIGIDPTYAERIFIIFQRLHGRDEYGGTGIGLSLCKKIVEFHGGRIWLDDQTQSGTTFQFILPNTEQDPS